MSRLSIDLTGQEYGDLKVVARANKRPGDIQSRWVCHCKKGHITEVLGSDLKRRPNRHCGVCPLPSIEKPRRDMTGAVFGRLVILRPSVRPRPPGTEDYWYCRCNCKARTEKDVRGADLRRGAVKSCGCLRRELVSERRTTHGESQLTGPRAQEYRAWKSIHRRCCNPNTRDYAYYGALGVTMSPTWQGDFEAFFDHIGKAPSRKHTVDRINPYGNYEPGNVRWATRKTQRTNQRSR